MISLPLYVNMTEKEEEEFKDSKSSLLTVCNYEYLDRLVYFKNDDGLKDLRNNTNNLVMKSYSMFTKWIKDGKTLDIVKLTDSFGKETGRRYVNFPFEYLYIYAFDYKCENGYGIPDGKVIYEEGVPFLPKPKDEVGATYWHINTSYCYETRLPNYSSENIRARLREDLVHLFGVTATTELRSLKCLVIVRDSTRNDKSLYSNKNDETFIDDKGSMKGITFSNMAFKSIIDYARFYDDRPLINETGLSMEPVTMVLKLRYPLDLQIINEDFKSYGLHIREEYREIPVLVLKKVQ
jgi:hypothetical protein